MLKESWAVILDGDGCHRGESVQEETANMGLGLQSEERGTEMDDYATAKRRGKGLGH